MMGKTRLTVFPALLAAGMLAAAASATASTSTVSLRTTAVGKVLVAAKGRTLYLFTADKGKKSTCYGQCAAYWPPFYADSPTVGSGLKASVLGTTKRKDGKLQVTYAVHPLYFFAEDIKARQIKGQGFVHFGGSWWVVSAVGTSIKSKAQDAMEFLIEFEVEVPEGTHESEVEERSRAEASATARLANEGRLLRVWRWNAVADDKTVIGLYAADSETELEGLLGALPLAEWMHMTVIPLAPHPNDPASVAR